MMLLRAREGLVRAPATPTPSVFQRIAQADTTPSGQRSGLQSDTRKKPLNDSAMVRFQVPMPSVYDRFNLVSEFVLAGDQERAIGELVDGLNRGDKHQVLLGVTG